MDFLKYGEWRCDTKWNQKWSEMYDGCSALVFPFTVLFSGSQKGTSMLRHLTIQDHPNVILPRKSTETIRKPQAKPPKPIQALWLSRWNIMECGLYVAYVSSHAFDWKLPHCLGLQGKLLWQHVGSIWSFYAWQCLSNIKNTLLCSTHSLLEYTWRHVCRSLQAHAGSAFLCPGCKLSASCRSFGTPSLTNVNGQGWNYFIDSLTEILNGLFIWCKKVILWIFIVWDQVDRQENCRIIV